MSLTELKSPSQSDWQVGSVVRVVATDATQTKTSSSSSHALVSPWTNRTRRCTGTIAMLDEEKNGRNATIFLNRITETRRRSSSEQHGPYRLMIPLEDSHVLDDEEELLLSTDQLESLLEFEYEESSSLENASSLSVEATVKLCKERGDALLRLGDPSAALSYYEDALMLSMSTSAGGKGKDSLIDGPVVQVGATVLLLTAQQQQLSTFTTSSSLLAPPYDNSDDDDFRIAQGIMSRMRIAEVDCVDDDQLDVTLVYPVKEGEEEAVISLSNVLLSISWNDNNDLLQVRILLNMTRCFLWLAAVLKESSSFQQQRRHQHRAKAFRHAAVRTSTMAILMLEHPQQDNSRSESENNVTIGLLCTALLLRSQALAQCCGGNESMELAWKDVNTLLKRYNPQHRQARQWKQTLRQYQQNQMKSNRRLVKGMSQWIDGAMKGQNDTKKKKTRPVSHRNNSRFCENNSSDGNGERNDELTQSTRVEMIPPNKSSGDRISSMTSTPRKSQSEAFDRFVSLILFLLLPAIFLLLALWISHGNFRQV